jgi:hypothetical protein
MKKVYVIFQDSDLKRLCWLKKGFRHCDIVFDNGISLEITFKEGFYVKQYDKNELFEKLKKEGIIIIEAIVTMEEVKQITSFSSNNNHESSTKKSSIIRVDDQEEPLLTN